MGTREDNGQPSSTMWGYYFDSSGTVTSDVLEYVESPLGQDGTDFVFDVIGEGEETVTLTLRNAGQGVYAWTENLRVIAD